MKIRFAITLLLLNNSFVKCNSQENASQPVAAKDTSYRYGMASVNGIGKFYWGREISQVMGAAGSDWLERADRNQEENTNLAIKKIIIPADGNIADIGAGTGYYSFIYNINNNHY